MIWDSWAHEGDTGYIRFGRADQLRRTSPMSLVVPVTLVEDTSGPYSGWLATGAAAPSLVRNDKVFRIQSGDAFAEATARGLGRIVSLRVDTGHSPSTTENRP